MDEVSDEIFFQYDPSPEMWDEIMAIAKQRFSELTPENLLINYIAQKAAFLAFSLEDSNGCFPCIHKDFDSTLARHATWGECEDNMEMYVETVYLKIGAAY